MMFRGNQEKGNSRMPCNGKEWILYNVLKDTPYDGTNRIRFIGYNLSHCPQGKGTPLYSRNRWQRKEEYPEPPNIEGRKTT